MSASYVKKYGTKAETTSTPGRSQVIQANKKRTNLLQDNSWIKKRPDEDVAKEENFGKVVLNRYKSEESLDSNANRKTSSEIKNPFPSQDTLTKRHSTSEAQLNKIKDADDKYKRQSWTTSDGKSSTSVTKSVTSTSTPDGKTTTVTTQQKPPTKTSSLKDDPYGTRSATTNKSETTEVKRFSTRYWDSVKTDSSVKSPVTTTRELDIVKSGSSVKSPVSTTTITSPLDDLYGSLVPAAKTASYSINRKSEPRTEYSYEYTDGTSTRKTSVSSRSYDIDFSPAEYTKTTYKDNSSPQSNLYEDTVSTKTSKTLYSSSDSYGYESSPTVYTKTTYKDNSSPQTNLYEDTVSSKSIKTVYSTSDRSVIEKDMCTYCRKPMSTDAKMILDEMKICCHASCFKCEVCNCSLGQLKAGDSLWIYRRSVHCENCFTNTREKWHR